MSDEPMTLEVSIHFGHVKIHASDGSMPDLFLSPKAAIEHARVVMKAARRAAKRAQ